MILFYLKTLLNNTNNEDDINIINDVSNKLLILLNYYINNMSKNNLEENINFYNYFYF